jgi:prepilin-type N-terminal cleavage/methylation domain-containing protein
VLGLTRRTRRTARAAGASQRRGFTLVELMVSVLMLTVAMLGLLSTSAAITRMMGKGSQRSLAAAVAESRFEKLRSGDCTLLSSGSATARGGIAESWGVQRVARAVIIGDSVRYLDHGITRSHAFQTVIPCPSLP